MEGVAGVGTLLRTERHREEIMGRSRRLLQAREPRMKSPQLCEGGRGRIMRSTKSVSTRGSRQGFGGVWGTVPERSPFH